MSEDTITITTDDPERTELRQAVRFFYDLQDLRILSGQRSQGMAIETAELSDEHKAELAVQSFLLDQLEAQGLRKVKRLVDKHPVWKGFLKPIKGIGPTLGGVVLSEIRVDRAPTVSALWSFCGLAVRDGEADRKRKGQRASYNPWLKAKMLKVMGDCMIKASSQYRKFYDDYKHRKENQLVPVCMACKGEGQVSEYLRVIIPAGREHGLKRDLVVQALDGVDHQKLRVSKSESEVQVHEGDVDRALDRLVKRLGVTAQRKDGEQSKCKNCDGRGKDAPWGRSGKHRHQAAVRYMIKMFLLELWKFWRELEGLPIGETYAEAHLGRKHGDHGGTVEARP